MEPAPLPEPEPEPEPLEPDPEDEPPLGLEPAPVAVALAEAPDPVVSPTPAEIPGEPLSAPVATADAETTVVAETVADPVAEPVAVVDADEDALQERSKSGAEPKVDPTMPKLGEGVSGAASCKVYHQVLVDPKREHPTSSQYVLALSMEATACPDAGPLTGQPVSVIQTGFPLTAAFVWSTALSKRD